jgi:hypothetical protein
MHRIDADSHVGNLFDEGDPGVPRAPTQVDADWLNAVQEEIANTVVGAGLSLIKGTNTQLYKATSPAAVFCYADEFKRINSSTGALESAGLAGANNSAYVRTIATTEDYLARLVLPQGRKISTLEFLCTPFGASGTVLVTNISAFILAGPIDPLPGGIGFEPTRLQNNIAGETITMPFNGDVEWQPVPLLPAVSSFPRTFDTAGDGRLISVRFTLPPPSGDVYVHAIRMLLT